MPTVCVSVCFSLLFFSSDRNKVWPGGNCRYLPITTSSPLPSPNSFPTLTHSQDATWCQTVFPKTTLPPQDSWDLALTAPSIRLFPLFPNRAKLLSQYLNIRVKRQYWERHLIAFRRHSHRRWHTQMPCLHTFCNLRCIKSKFNWTGLDYLQQAATIK